MRQSGECLKLLRILGGCLVGGAFKKSACTGGDPFSHRIGDARKDPLHRLVKDDFKRNDLAKLWCTAAFVPVDRGTGFQLQENPQLVLRKASRSSKRRYVIV